MGRVFAIACLTLLLLMGCSAAQAQPGLDSRISRLESDFMGIQSRLNQLETRIPRQGGVAVPTPSQPLGERRNGRTVTSADPQFDRLATLVIELKERVTNLETRLNKLQRR
jgi:uncharacterized protein YceH (UPF0502 family)